MVSSSAVFIDDFSLWLSFLIKDRELYRDCQLIKSLMHFSILRSTKRFPVSGFFYFLLISEL